MSTDAVLTPEGLVPTGGLPGAESVSVAAVPDMLELHAPTVLAPDPEPAPVVFDVADLSVFYGDYRAVRDVSMRVRRNEITGFIGPSGCGKTTVLRCFNRMNDLIEGARVQGRIDYHGVDLYAPDVNAVEVRRRIGMVFQKPNPFPKSIYDN
ncbi:MAG TPA: ATP-binding cassette domain-containing protein, partial [Microthrixaceae bacterium]|nr:ATP-binding cassette domain-containing protein [Microthrixaceae bacterium]